MLGKERSYKNRHKHGEPAEKWDRWMVDVKEHYGRGGDMGHLEEIKQMISEGAQGTEAVGLRQSSTLVIGTGDKLPEGERWLKNLLEHLRECVTGGDGI